MWCTFIFRIVPTLCDKRREWTPQQAHRCANNVHDYIKYVMIGPVNIQWVLCLLYRSLALYAVKVPKHTGPYILAVSQIGLCPGHLHKKAPRFNVSDIYH